jgi:hypothetical protein
VLVSAVCGTSDQCHQIYESGQVQVLLQRVDSHLELASATPASAFRQLSSPSSTAFQRDSSTTRVVPASGWGWRSQAIGGIARRLNKGDDQEGEAWALRFRRAATLNRAVGRELAAHSSDSRDTNRRLLSLPKLDGIAARRRRRTDAASSAKDTRIRGPRSRVSALPKRSSRR